MSTVFNLVVTKTNLPREEVETTISNRRQILNLLACLLAGRRHKCKLVLKFVVNKRDGFFPDCGLLSHPLTLSAAL